MSNGAVVFAQNNSVIDYTKMAVFSAERIKKYLNIPVSIITDNKDYLLKNFSTHPFDTVIEINKESCTQRLFYDGTLSSKKLDWNNISRYSVYELTPYDQTLVVDSDFIVSSSRLAKAFDRDAIFQIYKSSFDLAEWRDNTCFSRINHYSVPFYWATTFVFKKDPIIEAFFNLILYIKNNWNYFKILYSIDSQIFRNDFAFSIAIHIMNGKTNGEFATELPGNMIYSLDHDFIINIHDNSMSFLLQKQNRIGEYTALKTTGIDVHVMNKLSLLRCIDGGSGV